MSFVSIVLIAFALAMDAFAVSVSGGAALRRVSARQALLLASFFGGFQGLMPVVGWLVGQGVKTYVAAFDHWIAFGLLTAVGAKMALEASRGGADRGPFNLLEFRILLALSIATSLDALIVGISLSFVDSPILVAALVIAGVTFCLCLAGPHLGAACGHLLGRWVGVAGGLALAGLGVKILAEHTWG